MPDPKEPTRRRSQIQELLRCMHTLDTFPAGGDRGFTCDDLERERHVLEFVALLDERLMAIEDRLEDLNLTLAQTLGRGGAIPSSLSGLLELLKPPTDLSAPPCPPSPPT